MSTQPLSSTSVRTHAERLDEARLQLRIWISPLNVHVAVVVLLLLLNGWLLVQHVLVGTGSARRGDDAVIAAQTQLIAAEVAARPLRGVDEKLAHAQEQGRKFTEERLPYGYSDVASELGVLSTRAGVRLSRLQYVQAAPVNGLTEIRIDAAVTGEYRPLAEFLNSLERNKTFFLIQTVTLSGQQSGIVNLRLRLATYLREPMPTLPGIEAAGESSSGGRR